MAFARIPFPSLPWTKGGHPLELKKAWPAGTGVNAVTLLEFAAGFEDPNLCRNGHFIFVLEGTLELDLDSGTEHLAPGEACALEPGTSHRARNSGPGPTRLLVLAL